MLVSLVRGGLRTGWVSPGTSAHGRPALRRRPAPLARLGGGSAPLRGWREGGGCCPAALHQPRRWPWRRSGTAAPTSACSPWRRCRAAAAGPPRRVNREGTRSSAWTRAPRPGSPQGKAAGAMPPAQPPAASDTDSPCTGPAVPGLQDVGAAVGVVGVLDHLLGHRRALEGRLLRPRLGRRRLVHGRQLRPLRRAPELAPAVGVPPPAAVAPP